MLVAACAIVACIFLGACVKRTPRTEQKKDQPAPPQSNERCGLTCKMRQRNQEPGKKSPSPAPHKNTASRADKDKKKEDKNSGKSWRRQKEEPPENSTPQAPNGPGVYHTVKKGETFYRICKTYGADQNEVAKANHIADAAAISVGQKIWIPGADKPLSVPQAPLGGPANENRGSSRTEDPPLAARGTFILPVPNGQITSGFGQRDERMHEGVDICAPVGTPVLAADDGKVVYEGDDIRGYGNMIIIKHAGNLTTVYAHNSRNLVKTGDLVKKGQKIAEVGQTGRATGPHCHFEVRIGEKPVNPEFYLP
jgi:LysM repeat protein